MPDATRRLAAALFAASLAAGACTSTASPSAPASPIATAPASDPASSASDVPTAAASATPIPGPVVCAAADLAARVTLWDAAAGQRYGTVQLTNRGAAACELPTTAAPQLVDGGGNVLIAGLITATGIVALGAGSVVTTTVAVGNYCGPQPAAPITVAFVFGAGAMRIVAAPLAAGDTSGLPPCNGDPGSAGTIDMQRWAP